MKKLLTLASKPVTDDDIKKLKKRLAEAEKRFEEERRKKERDPRGFLNFQYTL